MFIERRKYYKQKLLLNMCDTLLWKTAVTVRSRALGGFEALLGGCELEADFLTGAQCLPFSASFPAATGYWQREGRADPRTQLSETG